MNLLKQLVKNSSRRCRSYWRFIGSKIADKITSLGKLKNKENEINGTEEIISLPEKRQQIINGLRFF